MQNSFNFFSPFRRRRTLAEHTQKKKRWRRSEEFFMPAERMKFQCAMCSCLCRRKEEKKLFCSYPWMCSIQWIREDVSGASESPRGGTFILSPLPSSSLDVFFSLPFFWPVPFCKNRAIGEWTNRKPERFGCLRKKMKKKVNSCKLEELTPTLFDVMSSRPKWLIDGTSERFPTLPAISPRFRIN